MTEAAVRPLEPGDDAAVRRLFRDTLCLGRPLPFEPGDLDDYQALCLDWYLEAGRADAALAVEGDAVAGYALVCTDAPSYHRWLRRRGAEFSLHVGTGLMTGRFSPATAQFYRLRLKDGWAMWKHGLGAPLPAHAHLNLVPAARATRAGRMLADHVDHRCLRAGLSGWFGEVNARTGHRARALERLGGTVVHRAPNHTLSWLLGEPVERLTVARRLAQARVGA